YDAVPLRNGNVLVVQLPLKLDGNTDISELDNEGRTAWETVVSDESAHPLSLTSRSSQRLSLCYGVLRVGFDGPRRPQNGVDAPRYSNRTLTSKDVYARRRAAIRLERLGLKAEQ